MPERMLDRTSKIYNLIMSCILPELPEGMPETMAESFVRVGIPRTRGPFMSVP